MRKITMKNTSENGGSVRDKSEDRATNYSDQDDDNKHDATEKDANKSFDTDKSFVDSENDKQSDVENDHDSDAEETTTVKSKSKKSPKKTKKKAANAAVNGKAGAKKSPKKKKAAKNNATEDDTEEEYEVEKVVNKKKIGSKTYYLIRWKGYSASSDSWEEEGTLNCDDLIKEYLDKAKKEPPQSRKRGPESPRRTQRVDYTEEDEEEYAGYSSSTRKRKLLGDKPAAKGKKAKQAESDEDESEEEEYEVDKILKVQSTKKGREFLVRWKGYPESQATWEPEKNLNCRDLLDAFLDKQKENQSPSKNKKAAATSPKSKKKAAAKSAKGRAGRAKAR